MFRVPEIRDGIAFDVIPLPIVTESLWVVEGRVFRLGIQRIPSRESSVGSDITLYLCDLMSTPVKVMIYHLMEFRRMTGKSHRNIQYYRNIET